VKKEEGRKKKVSEATPEGSPQLARQDELPV